MHAIVTTQDCTADSKKCWSAARRFCYAALEQGSTHESNPYDPRRLAVGCGRGLFPGARGFTAGLLSRSRNRTGPHAGQTRLALGRSWGGAACRQLVYGATSVSLAGSLALADET